MFGGRLFVNVGNTGNVMGTFAGGVLDSMGLEGREWGGRLLAKLGNDG